MFYMKKYISVYTHTGEATFQVNFSNKTAGYTLSIWIEFYLFDNTLLFK